MNLIFSILFAVLPPCPVEDATNCAWDGGDNSFVALHTPGTDTDLLLFLDGHSEVLPSNYP